MRATLVALVAALALVPIAAAGGPGTHILAAPGAWVTDFTTKVAAVAVGGELALTNADLMRHDVVARHDFGEPDQRWCHLFPAGKCPIFWSELAALGETVPVEGLDRLAELRTYTYYCTIHPHMQGTLVALPAT